MYFICNIAGFYNKFFIKGGLIRIIFQVWSKTDKEKEDKGPNGDVGIEGNSGSDGKGEWSEMVQACVEEG